METKTRPKRSVRKKSERMLSELAREKVPQALEAVCRVLREDEVKPAERLRAAEIIMDRAYGKAAPNEDAQADIAVVMQGFEAPWAE